MKENPFASGKFFFRKIKNQFITIANISSPNSWRKYFLFTVLLFVYAAFISSCKDPDKLGLEVQPSSDQLSVIHTDTTHVVTRTVREDTLRSSNVSLQLLGSYNDPIFGRSDASFYTQVYFGLLPVLGAATDALVADSLVLILAYSGHYGDTTTSQVAHVYRITEDILLDSSYYTDKTFTDDGVDLANNFTFLPLPSTPVTVNSVVESPELRIPLSMSLATQLVNLNGQSTFADNSTWIEYFKGLYVKTDPESGPAGQGSISYFDLYSPYSRMSLYFHNTTTGIDSLHYDFSFANTSKVNHQEHTYNGSATDVGHQLMDSTFNDTLNYIQSMGGVKTKITFPYLKHFVDSGNIAINKAELDITVQSGSANTFAPMSQLFLVAIDSVGNSNFLIDYYEGASYFGGTYNSTTGTYTFNIGRQLQRILSGQVSDHGMYLISSGSVVQASRVIIGSGKNTTYPMKLRLFYTKLH